MKKLAYMILGGMLALALVFGAAASFAQTDDGADTTTPNTETEADSTDDSTTQIPTERWGGHHGNGGSSSNNEALAEALGITVDELTAAKTEARTASINQAVADGLLTQEQADELLANGGGRWSRSSNYDAYLAEALGISEEELQAARTEVYTAQLAEMVAAGTITQEQADLMLAQKAVENYVDTEALQAALQAAYADAVAQALADGVITEDQATQLLENQTFNFHGFGNGFGGGGHHGHHGGGPQGFAPGTSAPTTTDTGSDA